MKLSIYFNGFNNNFISSNKTFALLSEYCKFLRKAYKVL